MKYAIEVLRVLYYFIFIGIYCMPIIGVYLMIIHLFLIIYDPKKYGVSRILVKVLNNRKKSFSLN